MGRLCGLWLALTACGRIGFDVSASDARVTDGPSSDTQPDASALACTPVACSGAATSTMCNGRCLSFCPDSVQQDVAETTCIAWGGHLATMHSAADNTCVSQLSTGPGIWIGFMQAMGATTVAGNWLWLDGQASPYVNWDSAGEPQDLDNVEDGTEQCANMYPNGTWLDNQCVNGLWQFECAR